MEEQGNNNGKFYCIELVNKDCYIGKLVSSNKNKTSFIFTDLQNLRKNENIVGEMRFYKNEIVNLSLFLENGGTIINDCDESIEKSLPSVNNSKKCEFITETNAEQMKRLSLYISNHTYIHQTDRTYVEAIAKLKNQEKIGCHIEGAVYDKHSNKLSLLCLTTSDNIYIFDIVFLGKIHSELKNILENRNIMKVVHNSTVIVNNLLRHDIQLNSIFDTLVAQKSTGNMDFPLLSSVHCFTKEVGLPVNVVEAPKKTNWLKRPLSHELKLYAAQNVAYLLSLCTHFTHKFLKPFYVECEKFSKLLDRDNFGDICYENSMLPECIQDFNLNVSNVSNELSFEIIQARSKDNKSNISGNN